MVHCIYLTGVVVFFATEMEPAAGSAAATSAAAYDAPYVTITLAALASPQLPLAQVSISRAPGSAHPEPLDAAPFSFQWTARHDSGALPEPPATGHYALALSALQEAKATMDLEFQRLLGKAPPAAAQGEGGVAEGGGGSSSGGAAASAAAAAAAAEEEGRRKDKKARVEAPGAGAVAGAVAEEGGH